MSDSVETLKSLRSAFAENDCTKDACKIDDVINDFQELSKQLEEANEGFGTAIEESGLWYKAAEKYKSELEALQPQWKPIEQLIFSAGDNKLYQWCCIDDPKLVVVLTRADFINRDDREYFTHYAPCISPAAPEERT